jgi:hypothetical protein
MRNCFSSATRLLGGGLLAGLLLASWLGPTVAQAQTAPASGVQIQPAPAPTASSTHIILDGPRHKGPLAVFYLDGQRRDSTRLSRLNPDDIASIDVLKDGALARQLGPDEARLGVIFITTKAGQHTHRVRAFNKRLVRLQQAEPTAAPGPVAP